MDWKHELATTVQRAKLNVIGLADITNEAHAQVVMTLLAIYGDNPAGALYIEPCLTRSSRRPPDIVLCHQEVGILVIEVKAFSIDYIQEMRGGYLRILRDGVPREENPLRQAQMGMFDIQHEVKRRNGSEEGLPLFNYMAALPNITSGEWNERGYDELVPVKEFLFKEHIDHAMRCQQRLKLLVQESLRHSRKSETMNQEQFQLVRRVFGDSAVVNVPRSIREEIPEKTWGAYIDNLAMLDKTLSVEQQELSRQEVEGTQRLIRGVAGSGKTVVLANQVARLVNRHVAKQMQLFEQPKPVRIAVVCFNRTLVPFIREKVEAAYQQQTFDAFPDGVEITHLNGLIYLLSEAQGGPLKYISTREVEDERERTQLYRQQIAALQKAAPQAYEHLLFDVIFVDEGQDCEPEEYQLLLDLLRPHHETGDRSLVIFYDDAQNIYARQRPNWKQIGIDVIGRSRVMKQGFRNPREVVELGFNVLIGAQSSPELRVQTRTYADLDYLKKADLVEDMGDHIRVKFALRSNKLWKPRLCSFTAREAEKEWLVREVARLLTDEHVRPEDILILFPARRQFQDLAQMLIQSCPQLEGVILPQDAQWKDSYIFSPNYLTLSTTHSAKGYDAPIVFVIGADLFTLDNEGRASFYVGVTRAKLLLYLSGLNTPGTLLSEAEAVSKMI